MAAAVSIDWRTKGAIVSDPAMLLSSAPSARTKTGCHTTSSPPSLTSAMMAVVVYALSHDVNTCIYLWYIYKVECNYFSTTFLRVVVAVNLSIFEIVVKAPMLDA